MIESMCTCGTAFRVPESKINGAGKCKKCAAILRPISAEPLGDGQGAGDFDARLTVTDGPDQVGTQFFLGGVVEVGVGKLPEKQISLQHGTLVSRNHCTFGRVDFGPSRWKLVDNKSTNGVFVNGERVTEQELNSGDEVRIGDYVFTYETDVAPPPPAAKAPAAATAAPLPPIPGGLAMAGGGGAGAMVLPGGRIIPPSLGSRATSRAPARDYSPANNVVFYLTVGLIGLPLLLIALGVLIKPLAMPAFLVTGMCALALILWGQIAILIIAFAEGAVTGLLYMFMPVYPIYFVLSRMDETGVHLGRAIAGFILMITGAYLLVPTDQ